MAKLLASPEKGVWRKEFDIRHLGLKRWPHHLLVLWPWADYIISLCLSFLICQMGTRIEARGNYCLTGLSYITYRRCLKHLSLCLRCISHRSSGEGRKHRHHLTPVFAVNRVEKNKGFWWSLHKIDMSDHYILHLKLILYDSCNWKK